MVRCQSDAEAPGPVYELPNSREPDEPSAQEESPSPFRSLLKTLRLNILYTLLAKAFDWPDREEARVAIYESRPFAAFYSILHILPTIGATILIYINVDELFVGYNIPWFSTTANGSLAALQFVAKTHELLILASISSIVFAAIRARLASEEGVPYGAVFVGTEISYLNTIWSMNLWAVFLSSFSMKMRARILTWLLIALFTISCILGALVGPSSANLMIPRWKDFPAGGTTYWVNATNDELFPSEIVVTPNLQHCTSRFDDVACPYGGFEIIAQSFMSAWSNMQQLDNTPETIYLPSKQALRAMTFRDRSQTNGSAMVWTNAFSLATVSPAAISDGLSMVGFLWAYAVNHADARTRRQWSKRDNAVYSADAQQPLVMVYCNQHELSRPDQNSVDSFADFGSEHITMKFDGDHKLTHYDNIKVNNSTTHALIQQFIHSAEKPSILWLDDKDLRQRTSSTLNAVASVPKGVLGYSTYYTCSIDSRFADVTLTTATHSPKLVSGYPKGMEIFGTYDRAWKRVYPSAQWANLVNVDFKNLGSTSTQARSPFAELIRASGLWNNSNTVEGAYAPYIVESALASLLANGIARLSYNTSMAGTLRGLTNASNLTKGGDWESELLPRRQMGWGGDAYNLSKAEQAYATKFTMRATASGYGYSWHGTAQMLAIGVLLTYILLAFGHIVYSIASGTYSGCWDTSADIVALAWRSRPAQFLKNTGTGIRSIATLQVLVRVVATGNEDIRTLQLAPLQPANGDFDYEPGDVEVNTLYA